jgi:two-component system sensor histidine kinase QseC
MNSIRSYLALRLLIGFILLLSLASCLIYFISKRILESDFDARLFAMAQAVVASTSQKGNRVDIDWNNLSLEIGPHGKQAELIQIFDSSGHSLGGNPFTNIGAFPVSEHGTYRDANSTQGEKLRILTLPFLPPVEEEDITITPSGVRQRCFLVVGSNRALLDHSLHQMAGVLVAMTIFTSILSLGIVILALRRGLRPLAALGLEVAKVDESSLEKRIALDSLPIELLPIAEKLNDLLSRLEVSFARERRFSADVSHELRTPVAELRSLSEVMLRQPHLPADTKQAFQDVLDASCQMEALVTTLLEIVRGERNTSTMEMREIDLCSFLQTSWKSYETKAQVKDLEVVFDLPAPLGMETDPRLLRLIFNNLFSNAVEYAPAGGALKVSIQNLVGRSVVSIQNGAQDISPEDLSHFFERFWRKDKVRGNTEHMGLGLSLTQMLCQRLQIHLTVSMPTPNLVCFWLTLPTLPDRK